MGEDGLELVPDKGPSAWRRDDGSVISAGGYVARTPSVANGMLLEPAWSTDIQPYADVVHEYVDEWFLAQMEPHPTGEPTEKMLAMEAPRRDLNAKGMDPMHTRLKRTSDRNRRLAWPDDDRSRFKLYYKQITATGHVMFNACEIDATVMMDQDSGAVVDDSVSSAMWEILVSPNPENPQLTNATQDGEKGLGGCG